MKVALIELGGSHVECMYAQILFLQQQQHQVHIICNHHLWPSLRPVAGIAGRQLHKFPPGFKNRVRAIYRIKKYLRRHGIHHVVINTIEISIIRDLLLSLAFRNLNITGVVHNARKLNSSFTVRNLVGLKMRKFFVLNDTLLQHIRARRGVTVRSFYPVFFPPAQQLPPVYKAAGECWVCIPGGIDPTRRDYAGLLHQIRRQGLPANMKIIFLGGLNPQQWPELAGQLAALPQQEQVITFGPEPVPQPVFDAWLQGSDMILPLLHPVAPRFAEYLTMRISGAYNQAFRYGIPLLMEASFAGWEDLRQHAIFYEAPELLNTLTAVAADPDRIRAMQAAMRLDAKFAFDTQCQRYCALVEQPAGSRLRRAPEPGNAYAYTIVNRDIQ